MSRIADPIDAGLTMIVGNRPRGRQGERENAAQEPDGPTESPLAPPAPHVESEPPALPDPPGTAFAVALAAGELPPVPPNPREAALRSQADWSPPDGLRRLTDRKV